MSPDTIAWLYGLAARMPEPIANLLLLLTIVGLGRMENQMRSLNGRVDVANAKLETLLQRPRVTDAGRGG